MSISTAPQSGGMPSGQIYGAGVPEPAISPVGEALFKVADTYLKTQTNKKIAQRNLEGQIAGQTREGLDRVRSQETFLNQIFGKSATLQGAERSFAETAVTDKFNDLSGRLKSEQQFKLKPKEYSDLLTKELQPLLATGDAELDTLMLESSSKVREALINNYNRMHHEYEQETYLASKTANIQAKKEEVGNGLASSEDYLSLLNRIANESEAGVGLVYTQALGELQRGDSTTFDLIQPSFTDENLNVFNNQQVNNLLNAKVSYDKAKQSGQEIRNVHGENKFFESFKNYLNATPPLSDGRGSFEEGVNLFTENLGYSPSVSQQQKISKAVIENQELQQTALNTIQVLSFGGGVDGLSNTEVIRTQQIIQNLEVSEYEKKRMGLLLGASTEQKNLMSSLLAGFSVENNELSGNAIDVVSERLDFYRESIINFDTAVADRLLTFADGKKPEAILAGAMKYIQKDPSMSSADALTRATLVYERREKHDKDISDAIKVISNEDSTKTLSDLISKKGDGFLLNNAKFKDQDSPAHALYLERVREATNQWIRENPQTAMSFIEDNNIDALLALGMRQVDKAGDYGFQFPNLKQQEWKEAVVDNLFELDPDINYNPDLKPSDLVSGIQEIAPNFATRQITSAEKLQEYNRLLEVAKRDFGISPDMIQNMSYNPYSKKFMFISDEISIDGYGGVRELSLSETAQLFKMTPKFSEMQTDILEKENKIRTNHTDNWYQPSIDTAKSAIDLVGKAVLDPLKTIGETAISPITGTARMLDESKAKDIIQYNP